MKGRKIVRRKSVEESAAQAVAEVVNGARGGKRGEEEMMGRASEVEANEANFAGVEGGVIGLGQSRWVERGLSTGFAYTYSEESGELIVQLPLMSDETKDSGRWALTFSWPSAERD